MRRFVLFTAVLLTACASNEPVKVADAAVTPFNDLNLVKAPIPETLVQALKAPYVFPTDSTCSGLDAEVRALDGDLGPDLDTPASDSNPGLMERGSDAIVGAVRRSAEGVVPFRNWVRKLSGAERYSKKVAAAITAGTVRRAYLKGIAQAKGC
jgi:hypothetical protein